MTTVSPPTVDLQALSDRLKVLAEPKRLLILHTLMQGVQCNCELLTQTIRTKDSGIDGENSSG
jgi:DNA-binding transcriptional ArsR family regulator